MSEIRSVSVHLDADVASYIAKMKLAGDATDKAFANSSHHIDSTNRSLSTTEQTLGRVDTQARKLDTDTSRLGRTLDTGGRSIDRYSGRLGVMGDALLALGPAAVTTSAVAVPALAGIGSEVGFLVAGVGTGVLAFHGFGDALTKFNKAALDPTDANLKAAHLAMEQLPPDAQRLVLQLHRLNPEVERLQRAAGSGLFRGVSSGLRDVVTDAPIAERGLHGIGIELGDLARDAGRSLSSRTWKPFLRFLGREAPASIDATARSVGHVTHGLAELWMAFDPVNDDLDAGILRVAKDFDRWAASLGRTQGFQDFLDYYRENGPRVIALLGQTATTLIDIGEAAAPLGGPVLDTLTSVLKVVDAVANSDFGTPLIGGLLAFRLYARVAQLAGLQVETSFKGMAAAPGQVQTRIASLASTTRASTSSIIGDLRLMSTEFARVERTTTTGSRSLFPTGDARKDAFFNPLVQTRQIERSTKAVGGLRSTVLSYLSSTSEASQRTRARLGELAKGGAIAAGVAVVATGAADKLGLSNTASLALAGSLAGPYGAAVGGAIGYTLDLAHADDQVVDATHRLQDAAKGLDFSAQRQDFADLTAQSDAFWAQIDQFKSLDASFKAGPVAAFKTAGAGINEFFTHSHAEADQALADAGNLIGLSKSAFTLLHDALQNNTSSPFLDVTPKASTLPLTIEQLQQTANRAQPAMLALGISVTDLQDAAARGDGSLEKLTGRIARYIERSDSAAGRTDAVAKAFAGMADETLTTDQRVQSLTDSLDALLGPTLGLSAASDQYTSDLHSLRSELAKHSRTLVGNTDAALTNRAAIRSRVSDLSDLIKAEAQAGASPEKLTSTLKTQRQALINAGVAAGISRSQMRDYLDELGLTPKLVRTAIELSGVGEAESNLQNLTRDRVIHITVRTDHLGAQDTTGTGGHVLTGHAGGGTIPGPRYPYGDKVLVPLAPTEEVTPNDRGQADMNRAALKAAARGARLAVIGGGLAGGGTVDRYQRVSTHLTTSSSRSVERIVERLPRRMRLAVDGDELYAVLDNAAQANYEANMDHERAMAGG